MEFSGPIGGRDNCSFGRCLRGWLGGEFVQPGFSSEGLSERFYLGYGSESWRSGFIIGHFPDRRLFHSDELRAGKVHDVAQDTV